MNDIQTGNTATTLSNLGNTSVSLLGTGQIGEVVVNYGNGRKTVHKDADPNSAEVAYLNPGTRCPCYGSKTGNWDPVPDPVDRSGTDCDVPDLLDFPLLSHVERGAVCLSAGFYAACVAV